MKSFRIFGREISFGNNRYNVHSFSKEKILSGFSFNIKQINFKQLKTAILATFMPYDWLNSRFMKNKI